jgi:hypothetical protein
VEDTTEGLVWQNSDLLTTSITWAEASARCSQLNLDGGGWRMPTEDELLTIYDHVGCGSSWSSTLEGSEYVGVYFGLADPQMGISGRDPSDTLQVRCVR